MAKAHKTTVSEVIRSRAVREGYGTVAELAERIGIPRSTMYERLSRGGWTLSEVQAMDRVLHFTQEDTDILYGR